MLGYSVHKKRFWVVKWDVEAFMRCVFGDNDTPREQGACALEVPRGVMCGTQHPWGLPRTQSKTG